MSAGAPLFRKVLIANRGEIAVRIARTLQAMGIGAVGVYSDADRDARHVRAVDEAYHVGPALPSQSYLNQERLLAVARQSGAEAIHPGYGFLSENAAFARRCADEELVFIGPSPAAIDVMGSKVTARRAARASGFPIVPGSEAPLDDAGQIETVAGELGYPIAIKAAAGGGGYGMRIVAAADQIQAALDGVRRDAQRAFGDSTVYVEKFLSPAPRHVEIQILGDQSGRVVHLGERECSLQRRFQKVVEETPSPAVGPELRARLGEAALKLAAAIGYLSAGTIECLLDREGRFYFLEMNTRLQVEHPVTEVVSGIDLVEQMVRVAAGQPLSIPESARATRGHAIEARVYAEDPAKGFIPSPGEIRRVVEPTGPGIRVDSGIEAGSKISVYYDAMIAKIVAWGEDRVAAIDRLREAIGRYEIDGVQTNLPFLARLVDSAAFRAGDVNTRFIDDRVREFATDT